MIKITHITPHLGGGVGKTISGLVEQSDLSSSNIQHNIICLEKPKKSQFIDKIYKYSGNISVEPNLIEFGRMLKNTDIVHLHYWNHPILFKYLCSLQIAPIRLITWHHNNGLYNPIIPKQLILNSHVCLFTTDSSFENIEIKNLIPELDEKLGVVYGSGGFTEFPEPRKNDKNKINEQLSVGYFGSTSFSKLHPNYVNYLNEAKTEIYNNDKNFNFKVKMIGDLHNEEMLKKQCNSIGKTGLLNFTGYVPNIITELQSINVLAYILNPHHYGASENTLLESMSMGIVPIVLDNPPEKCIVDDYETGFIIENPKEFATIIQWLHDNPKERYRIGLQASKLVREKFSSEKIEFKLNCYYKKVIEMEKQKINFKDIFGNTPNQWFLSCQNDKIKKIFKYNGEIKMSVEPNDYSRYMLFEKTKGSVFHFREYYPENSLLKDWSTNLKMFK